MWVTIGKVASVIQILSGISLRFTAWWFVLRAARYRNRTEAIGKEVTARPMALAIGLAGMDISGQVKSFLAESGMKMEVQFYTKQGASRKRTFMGCWLMC